MKEENENNQFNQESGNFGLPEGYFQKSASSIFNKIAWQEEHKAFPKLVELKDANGFNVPVNYFVQKEQQLELLQYPSLNAIQDKNPFSVPDNYFADLEIQELSKVLKEEKDELSAFVNLKALPKQNALSVPEGYFEAGESRLKEVAAPEKQAKVVSMFSKKTGYAAAALLVVVMGVWIYNFYFVPVQVEDCGTIACLDKQDLVKTKNLERLDDEDLYELVDPAALEKKLETKEVKKTNTAEPGINKSNTDSSLDALPEEDLLDDI